MPDDIKTLWRKATQSASDQLLYYGKLGRTDSDTAAQIAVTGREGWVHVRLSDRTVTQARNDAGVPLTAGLQVKMRREHGDYVIQSASMQGALVVPDPVPASGVRLHAATHQHDGTDEIATATPAANAIPKADASGTLDSWVTHITQEQVEDWAAAMLTGNTGIIDATYDDTAGTITLTLDVSAADKILYSTAADTWAETALTSFARTLLDDADAATARATLGLGTIATEAETNYLLASGARTLSGDWDIGNGRKLKLERIDARDADGISFYDDGGNLVLFLEDGGNVGVGQSNPRVPLHVLVQAISNTRETFAKFQTSDAGDAALFFFNQTSANGGLMPCIGGLADDAARPSLDFGGYITSAMDTGTAAIIRFNANVTSDATDPPNGTLSAPATRPLFAWTVQGSVLMQMLANGDLGLGVTAPQGPFHIHDGVSGWLFVTKTGIGASAQTIIPNGTGDVTGALWGSFMLSSSGGIFSGGTLTSRITPGNSETIGAGFALDLRVNADGSVDIRRVSGSDTWTANLFLQWI